MRGRRPREGSGISQAWEAEAQQGSALHLPGLPWGPWNPNGSVYGPGDVGASVLIDQSALHNEGCGWGNADWVIQFLDSSIIR